MIKTWKERYSHAYPKVSREDSMLAEIDELREALAARDATPYCYVPPERDGEFHHSHSSIMAFREKMAGWMPLYTTPQPPATLMDAARLALVALRLGVKDLDDSPAWANTGHLANEFHTSINALNAAGVTP